MQPRELRKLTTDELQSRLDEAYQEQFNLRRAVNLGRLEDTSRVEAVKRDIARIKTILRERELGAELSGAGEEVQ
ncbi:MAG: 50S ribosomal protein L29 [Anaerolineales bacterium]|nr:50S ribosomal protein L29 [Anaerolineales bacterium]